MNNLCRENQELNEEITALKNRIDELERTEEFFRKERETFHTILENNPAGVALIGPDGVYQYVNPEFTSITGYTLEDVPTGKDWFRKAYPDSSYRKVVIDTWKQDRLSETGRSMDRDFTIVTKDGKKRDVDIRSTFGNDFIVTVLRDITQRKQVENELHQGEMRLRTITESARDAIIMMDSGGLITYWNEAATRMFGHRADEAVGKELHALLASRKYYESSLKGLHRFQKSGEGNAVGKILELSAVRKDGAEFPIELSLSAVNMQGKWMAVGILRDITERRRAEETLLMSEKKFSKAFNSGPASMSIVRLDDRCYVEVNDTFQQMWGFDRNEVVGRPVADVGIWPYMEQWEYVNRLFASQGRIRDLECHLRTRTAYDRTVLLSAQPIEVDGQPCMLLITADITERAQAVEALRRANAYNQGLMEARLDPVVVIGPDNTIAEVNPAAEQITGYQRDMLLGTDFSDYFVDPEKARAAYREAYHRGLIRDYSLELKHRDGRVASVLYNASMCWDEDGQFIGVVVVAHDITLRRQAEARLKESEERYRTAIEHSNDGVAIAREGRHVYVNQKFLDIFGYDSANDIIADTAHKEVHPDDREMVSGVCAKEGTRRACSLALHVQRD